MANVKVSIYFDTAPCCAHPAMKVDVMTFLTRSIFVLLFSASTAFGQVMIRGSVVDSATAEPLVGASVMLKGTAIGAPTDLDGHFRLANVASGSYTIFVSYLGFHSTARVIDVADEDIELVFRLSQAILEGDEVIVTGQLKGQVAAINQQITSKTIINVVSEEKIKELPDANAAEAIGRLPGVSITRSGGEATGVVLRGLSSKFSNITVDGVKIPPTSQSTRDVDLSMLSQGALAGIELHKTLTPDQDADAIAGAVNLVTKSAPEERLLYLDVKGGYNHLIESFKQYDVQARYGERFFDNILGVQFQANIERKIRSRENTNTSYYTYDNPTLPDSGTYDPNQYDNDYLISQFQVRFIDEVRRRNGGQIIFDFRTPDAGVIKAMGVYSETRRETASHERFYPGQGASRPYAYNYDLTELNTSTVNTSLQGTNNLLGIKTDWLFAFAQSKTENPFNYRTSFSEATPAAFQPSRSDPDINIIAYAPNMFNMATLDSTALRRNENYDKELTAAFNVSRQFDLGGLLSDEVKVGWKFKDKSRSMTNGATVWNNYLRFNEFLAPDGSTIDFSSTRFAAPSAVSAPVLTMFFDGNPQSRNLLGKYSITPLISMAALRQWVELTGDGGFIQPNMYGTDDLVRLNNYFVQERVQAAYVMNTLTLGQSATLIFGVRMEHEKNDYDSQYASEPIGGTGVVQKLLAGSVIDTVTSYTETIWLPSVQVAIRPTEYLTFRLAAYRALARPDFNLRIPQFSFTQGTGGLSMFAGNPMLEDSKAWNFEVNTQVHDNTIGLVSVSAFYKTIDHLFHRANGTSIVRPSGGPNQRLGLNGWTTSGESGAYDRVTRLLDQVGMSSWRENAVFNKFLGQNYTSFSLFIPYNSPTPSTTWGFEFEHQMNFGFIPVSWLKAVTLSYNFSITRSRTEVLLSRTVKDTAYNPTAPVARRYSYLTGSEAVFETRDSEDQPEFYANAVIGYDIGGLSARLSFYYQDKYTSSYSTDGTNDAIVDAFSKLDLSLKYEVTPNVSVFLNTNNLLNKFESTSRLNNVFAWGYTPRTAELYGTTADLGVRVTL
jgi:TonB-dependent receptor